MKSPRIKTFLNKNNYLMEIFYEKKRKLQNAQMDATNLLFCIECLSASFIDSKAYFCYIIRRLS